MRQCRLCECTEICRERVITRHSGGRVGSAPLPVRLQMFDATERVDIVSATHKHSLLSKTETHTATYLTVAT